MAQSILNPILSRWLKDRPDLVAKVDCDVCTLAGARPAERERWAKYKCCTFQPYVSCFAAGAMLSAGIDPLRVDRQRAVLLPIGVVASDQFRTKLLAIPDGQRGEEQLCTYFNREIRRCGIWQFRPGECSVYFCAEPGKAERDLLSKNAFALEAAVAQMALVHLGYSPEFVAEQVDLLNGPGVTPQELSPTEAYRLYRATWEWASQLSSGEVLSWLDSEPEAL